MAFLSEEMNTMGIDWRKKEDYDYTDTLSPEGWAWEFLRRLPEYRKRSYVEYKIKLKSLGDQSMENGKNNNEALSKSHGQATQ